MQSNLIMAAPAGCAFEMHGKTETRANGWFPATERNAGACALVLREIDGKNVAVELFLPLHLPDPQILYSGKSFLEHVLLLIQE